MILNPARKIEEFQLGQIVEHEGQKYRVVRMVHHDESLFFEGGLYSKFEDSYVQLMNAEGMVEFYTPTIPKMTRDVVVEESEVKALNGKAWRKE